MASCTSPLVSKKGLPISRVIARAISLLRSVMMSPTRFRISPRLGAGILRHESKAALAASTAAATSSADESGKWPIRSDWRAGLRLSKVAPEAASTHWPLM